VTVFGGKGFDELTVGERFRDALTVTDAHIVQAAGLCGDFNPVHLNQRFAEQTIFGGRIAHGYFTSSWMAAIVGMAFAGTGFAYLEHACRFKAPVRPGDTVEGEWTVMDLLTKPKHQGGIVVLAGTCRNHHGDTVAELDAKILVKDRAAAPGS
jgi:acyl dehydratase